VSARTRFRAAVALGAALTLAHLAALAPRARAAAAPRDTTIEGYVRSMADSTDRFFGLTAQPSDTTGLDSLRGYYLAHPNASRRAGRSLELMPLVTFNRVLGLTPGAEAAVGFAERGGHVSAAAQWAPGPDLWLGDGAYQKRWTDPLETRTWELLLRAGRDAASLDRDDDSPGLSPLRALLTGGDRTMYKRLDGGRVSFERTTPGWSAGLGARDQLESPMATTATWTIGRHALAVTDNTPATPARVHEAGAWGSLRLPWLPLRLQAHAWRGGGGLGGDASYTRLRATLGGGIALGRHLTLAPQADYGRLHGDVLPQEAFYVGGTTLYTVPQGALQGTGRALARAELLLVDPVQRLLGLEKQPLFPIQLGAFGGLASRWGDDPVTGAAELTSRDWPHRTDWLGEAGVSVMYRPGVPDPLTFVKVSFARPIGPDDRAAVIAVTFIRTLNFLQPH